MQGFKIVSVFVLLMAMFGKAGADTDNPAQRLIFDTAWLKELGAPFELSYDYTFDSLDTRFFGESFEDTIVLEVEEGGEEADFNQVTYDIFSGKRNRRLGPYHDVNGNPISIIYLEKEVFRLGPLVKSNPGVLRNIIRRSFRFSKEAEHIHITHQGKKLKATRIVLTPFQASGLPPSMKQLKDKAFEFIISAEIPGGIYSIKSALFDTDKPEQVIFQDNLTFKGITRP